MSQVLAFKLPSTARSGNRWAWALWLIVLLVMCGLMLNGNRRSVTPAYHGAALRWLSSRPLYDDSGRGFLYLPTAAVAYVPFAVLPHTAGEIAWRLLAIGCYAWGLWRACRLIQQQDGRQLFLLATLLTLPLCLSSARNGQSTLPMTGLMLLGAVAAAEGRWWRSAACLALSVALKPLAIVMLLLMGGVHAPLRWRLPLALAAVFAAPFLLQTPAYVAAQYAGCWEMFQAASDFGYVPRWSQPFAALEVWGLAVPRVVQTILRVLAAGLTLGLAVYAQRKWQPPRAAIWIFTLAACYLMLFNPRTENNTYSCLGPAIGLAFAFSWGRQHWLTAGYVLLAIGVVAGWSLSRLVTSEIPPIWLAPLSATIFAGICVRQIFDVPIVAQPAESLPMPRRLAA